MSYDLNDAPQRGTYSVTITGGTSTAGGGQAAIPNPEGVNLWIRNWALAVTASSTGAANLTIGTAASGTVAATNLMGATAMAAGAGSIFTGVTSGTVAGQNVTTTTMWGSAHYLNVAASASAVGLEAVLFIDYVRI